MKILKILANGVYSIFYFLFTQIQRCIKRVIAYFDYLENGDYYETSADRNLFATIFSLVAWISVLYIIFKIIKYIIL